MWSLSTNGLFIDGNVGRVLIYPGLHSFLRFADLISLTVDSLNTIELSLNPGCVFQRIGSGKVEASLPLRTYMRVYLIEVS